MFSQFFSLPFNLFCEKCHKDSGQDKSVLRCEKLIFPSNFTSTNLSKGNHYQSEKGGNFQSRLSKRKAFLRGGQRWNRLLQQEAGPVPGAKLRAELTSDKDMYLDNSSIEEASGVYPIDDDDYASASGSGADEDVESPELTTSRPLPKIPFTSAAPKVETTTLNIQNKIPAQTKSPEETDKEKVHLSDSERKMDPAEEDTNVYTEKHSDSLFKRTEVLAAVIAGGVIGFLFAIFLILLLVYRMRKKDEGSYDLGERKPSSAAYQKAPTKEFYA
ncbi:syndecan-2 isoform X1 [Symphalangus syndactylus]|nr:syndecan-2 isoform X1 [Symphalangus syndactylus]